MPKSSEPRGRGETTRQRIVEQSAPIFNRRGFEGTSISEVMAVTGLEKGGIYRHFDSKESLAAAAFDYAWNAVSAPRRRGIAECPAAIEKLLLLVRNFVEEVPQKMPGGCPLLNTAVDSDDGNPVLRARARAALAEWRSNIADLVRSGQASGEFRAKIDADAIAVVVIASLEGAVMIGRMEKSRDALRQVREHLEEYLLGLQVTAG